MLTNVYGPGILGTLEVRI